eukprot:363272-Chlamydomonas_euryale.AAC.10
MPCVLFTDDSAPPCCCNIHMSVRLRRSLPPHTRFGPPPLWCRVICYLAAVQSCKGPGLSSLPLRHEGSPCNWPFVFMQRPATPPRRSPTGALSNRRLVYEMPAGLPGGPDGAQTDADGFIWVCLSGASQV